MHKLLSLALLLLAIPAAAGTSALSGRVTDPAGAAVPGARIEVLSLATNSSLFTLSGPDGSYLLPGLEAGRYEIRVSREGFQSAHLPNLTLHVASQLNRDFQLQLGSIAQTVEVSATNTLVEQAAISVSTTVDRRFAENLPLNGRSFQTLLELTPGIQLVPATGAASPGQFVVNGQRSNSNYFQVDGVSANVGASPNVQVHQQSAGSLPGLTAMGGTNNLVSVEALEEFRVQTSTFAPEYGRMPGGQISLTTRSGTNRFSGSLYEYFRNEKLDANDWFSNAAGLKRAPLRQNNFGGTLGGPIVLPKLYNGHNRSFFFFSQESQRNRIPQFVDALVPDEAIRAKALPATAPLLAMSPLPNRASLPGDPVNTGRYTASYGDPQSLDATALKLNHQLSTRLQVFGRYNHSPSEALQRVFANQSNSVYLTTNTLTLGANATLSPRLFSEFRANYSKFTSKWNFEQVLLNGAQPAPDSLWPSGWTRDTASVSVSMGLLNYGTANNLTLGPVVNNGQRQWNLVENLSYQLGAHSLKVGVDYRRLAPLASTRTRAYSYTFASVSDVALTGVTGSFSAQSFAPPGHFHFDNLSGFAQDSWRAAPRLTLTFGLRWELNPPPSERDGLLPYTATGLDNPMTAALAPLGTPLWETRYTNFAPRLGASYLLSQRHNLLLRGGWGIYHDLGTGLALSGFQGWPYSISKSTAKVAFPAAGPALDPGTVSTTPPVVASSLNAFPGLLSPKTYQWNATLEKGFGLSSLLSVSYVGAAGRDLLLRDRLANSTDGKIAQLNPAQFAKGSSIFVARNQSSSDYHALQTQFRRRLQHGLQAQASWTWSKAIDDLSDETATTLPLWRPESALQRGPASFDIRHGLTAALSYDLPSARLAGPLRPLLRDWGLDAFLRLRTASPVNLVQSSDLLGAGVSSVVRPDLVWGVPVVLDDPNVPGGRKLNAAAFKSFTDARQGTLGRNALRGFDSIRQLDLSIRRDFPLREQLRLQLRGEFFNLTNSANFGQPTLSLTSAKFGQSTTQLNRALGSFSSGGSAQGFSPLYQAGGPRSIQLSLKLFF